MSASWIAGLMYDSPWRPITLDTLMYASIFIAGSLVGSQSPCTDFGGAFETQQQVTVQTAFSGPLAISERVGTLDAAKLAASDLDAVFREKPAVHRFPGKMAERVHQLVVHVRDEYAGDAGRVWGDAKNGEQLRANLSGLPGFGEMKVKSLGAVLAKRYKLAKAKSLVPPHPTLGDVDSPQALLDYQAAKRQHKAEWSRMKAR
jgi:uncharacterized HhH-GPD family protein